MSGTTDPHETWHARGCCLEIICSQKRAVLFKSWFPNCNGSRFGLPPSSICKMSTGLGGKIVWTMTYAHKPHMHSKQNSVFKSSSFGLRSLAHLFASDKSQDTSSDSGLLSSLVRLQRSVLLLRKAQSSESAILQSSLYMQEQSGWHCCPHSEIPTAFRPAQTHQSIPLHTYWFPTCERIHFDGVFEALRALTLGRVFHTHVSLHPTSWSQSFYTP